MKVSIPSDVIFQVVTEFLASCRWAGVFIRRAVVEGSEHPHVYSSAGSVSAGQDGCSCGSRGLSLWCTEWAGTHLHVGGKHWRTVWADRRKHHRYMKLASSISVINLWIIFFLLLFSWIFVYDVSYVKYCVPVSEPSLVNVVDTDVIPPAVVRVMDLAFGREHSLALSAQNELWAWGSGCQLGLVTSTFPVCRPQKVCCLRFSKFHNWNFSDLLKSQNTDWFDLIWMLKLHNSNLWHRWNT